MDRDERIAINLLDQLIDKKIEKAKNAKKGNTEAAREILKMFHSQVRPTVTKIKNNEKQPEFCILSTHIAVDARILQYMAGCVEKIINDAPGQRMEADRAFGLTSNEQGNKETVDSREKKLDIGFMVMERHQEIKSQSKTRLRGDASPLDQAIAAIAYQRKLSTYTIQAYYNEFNALKNSFKIKRKNKKNTAKT